MVELDRMRMRAYYERMEREGGFVSFCRMWLPEDMAFARVLDVGCRRGKGVYQISEHVGANGFVLGVDWSEPFLERARAGEAAALARGGLSASNMAFRFGWPEDLRVAEVADGSFDIAIANSVMNVAFNRQSAYAEIARALVPGGLFYYAAVVADGSPDENALQRACEHGDVVAAALPEEQLLAELRAAGFASCDVVERMERLDGARAARPIVVAARTLRAQ